MSAFLLIFSEVWDHITKLEEKPMDMAYIPPTVQKDAIVSASRKWVSRDQTDNVDGSLRYSVLGKVGTAIRRSVVLDRAISNPGHTGISLRANISETV